MDEIINMPESIPPPVVEAPIPIPLPTTGIVGNTTQI